MTIQHKKQLEQDKKSMKQSLTQQINMEFETYFMAREKSEFNKLEKDLNKQKQQNLLETEAEFKQKLDAK